MIFIIYSRVSFEFASLDLEKDKSLCICDILTNDEMNDNNNFMTNINNFCILSYFNACMLYIAHYLNPLLLIIHLSIDAADRKM